MSEDSIRRTTKWHHQYSLSLLWCSAQMVVSVLITKAESIISDKHIIIASSQLLNKTPGHLSFTFWLGKNITGHKHFTCTAIVRKPDEASATIVVWDTQFGKTLFCGIMSKYTTIHISTIRPEQFIQSIQSTFSKISKQQITWACQNAWSFALVPCSP